MNETITLALEVAERNYIYNRNEKQENTNLKLADHIIALNALFESFIHYGFAVSQIPRVLCELDVNTYLYESLIEPHLRVVDDVEMISKQYSIMYVQYIAKIAQGAESKEAVKNLFA